MNCEQIRSPIVAELGCVSKNAEKRCFVSEKTTASRWRTFLVCAMPFLNFVGVTLCFHARLCSLWWLLFSMGGVCLGTAQELRSHRP